MEDCSSQIGSGSLPVESLTSAALVLRPSSGEDSDLRTLVGRLRQSKTPILGRVSNGALWLDLRCLEAPQEAEFVEYLKAACL